MKTNTTSENAKTAILVLLLLYGLVGRMDYEDEVMREAEGNSYHHHQGEQQ